MSNPLVSIILSTYNGSYFITESIDSVINQSYSNFEFIIINDFSKDNVEEIILNYQKKDKRIIYIKNNINLNLTKSLNKWLQISKWKYIARIDDDIWLNEKLEKQVNFMENNLDYWLCWTNVITINKNWEETEQIKMRQTDNNIRNHLLQSNQFAHSSIIMRKNILNKVWWFYNESYNNWEDYELWLRIWKISKLHNLSEYLVKYRWLNTSISRKKWLKQEIMAFKIMIKNKNYYPNFLGSLFLRIITMIIPQKVKKKIISFIKK